MSLKQDELNNLVNEVKSSSPALHAVVHSIAFANKDDLSRPFLETSRDGYLLAQEVSSYSLVSVARALVASDDRRRFLDDSDVSRIHPRGPELQRDGRSEGGARSFCSLPCKRSWAPLKSGSTRSRLARSRPPPLEALRISPKCSTVSPQARLSDRNTDPAEVADTAVFLASDLGRGVTGNVIFVDAGFQTIGLMAG